MSKKRIVKETLMDGTIQYRVEVFVPQLVPLFNLFSKGKWITDSYFEPFGYGVDLEAVFDTLEEAELHAFGDLKSEENVIVKREILNYERYKTGNP